MDVMQKNKVQVIQRYDLWRWEDQLKSGCKVTKPLVILLAEEESNFGYFSDHIFYVDYDSQAWEALSSVRHDLAWYGLYVVLFFAIYKWLWFQLKSVFGIYLINQTLFEYKYPQSLSISTFVVHLLLTSSLQASLVKIQRSIFTCFMFIL